MGSGLAKPRSGTRFVEVVSTLTGLEDDWRRLAAASRNVFATYDEAPSGRIYSGGRILTR